ncbi:sensor histidine kinase [Embleya scabrispora]|uniref:sensor histidine kinase n=1 Tax=Embleya scabrispora TaxID=159449 RepID=UPI00047557EC|nr:sensor histidine kinase [Embleya scabrispora]MYS81781.1 sensor histidine kinase [Streptomyces sp. SID5474]
MSSSFERYAESHARSMGRHARAAEGRVRSADVVTAVALCVCTLFGAQISTSDSSPPHALWPAWILVVSGAAVLAARTHPRATLAVTTGAAALLTALGYLPSPLLLAPVMTALYWLAALTDSRTTGVYGSVTLAVLVATSLAGAPLGDDFILRTVGTVLWLLLPVSLGSRSRFRRAYLESVKARAAHAERTREEEARLRVAEERMHIARELHDAVAHHMAVAHAQAGTAAHLADTHPEQTRKILADLVGTTTSALLELRATVGVLRQTADPHASPLEPTPGLDRLPELVAACVSTGLTVTVDTEGETRPLSPGVDLTAYRIIQEALTNATKHAPDHAARVRLRYDGSRLLITVTNDGTMHGGAAPPMPGGGYGLMGMRERAQSVGGDLRAGPRPEGGFEVAATLPFQPRTPADDPTGRRPEETR